MFKWIFLSTLLYLPSGCVSIPTQNLDAYKSSYSAAKTATEDIVLRGKVAAKTLAEDPLNSQLPAERLTKLKERDQAADERLLALETIDRYNSVLVQLAEGKDPKEIQSNLEKFGNCLTKLGSSRITSAVGKAVPYVGVAAEIIAMIDDATNRKAFFDLVKKGGDPVRQIIDILIADADNIYTVVSQQIMMPRDICDNHISDIQFRFKRIANNLQKTSEVLELTKKINDARKRLVHRKLQDVVIVPIAGATDPNQGDLELLDNLVSATENEVSTANSITSKVEDYNKVIEEYKSLLDKTKKSLVQLEKAIELNRPVATADFINRALGLREAIIKLREGV
jgi:hypothetical protein